MQTQFITHPTPTWRTLRVSIAVLIALSIFSCGESSNSQSQAQSTPSLDHKDTNSSNELKPTNQSTSLRVATFNINFGNVDLPQILQAIVSVDADFVFLQETNIRSETYLREKLSETYKHQRFSESDARWAAGGFGFLSKLPFSEPEFIPAKHGLFGIYRTVLTVQKQSIALFNLHLSPIRVDQVGGVGDLLSELFAMEEIHGQEADLIKSLIDATGPTIVAGDLNSISSNIAPTTILGIGMSDSIADTIPNADQTPTWHWQVAGRDLALRLDYIFHSSHFSASHSEIFPCSASDHEVVVTELTWK